MMREVHQANIPAVVRWEGKRHSHLSRKRKAQAGEVGTVMRRETSSTLVLEGDDTVPATTVGRTGMWLGSVEAQDIAWARQPDLAIT